MLTIETSLVLLAVLTAVIYPTFGAAWFEKIERDLLRISRRRTLSVITVGLAALIARLAVLPVLPVPEPTVHDEFSHLLAADTFLHGRLTNPTHPMWPHFETFHVMFHPNYGSVYPPAQGLVLALGKLIFGHPFWGVWLSVGVMCASITWALQGWFSGEWALVGGALAILRYAVFSYWGDSYFGGAVAAIGGALVLGALPRIKQSQRVRDALLLGLGLAILANSRPYEGFVLSLPVGVFLLAWMLGKNGPPVHVSLARTMLPLAIVVVCTGAGMGYYQWRVTGSPFRMPYQIERQTYAVAPYMIWQPVRPEPAYHHPIMRKMFVEEEMFGRSVSTFLTGAILQLYLGWSFFLGPALALPLLMLVFTLTREFSLRKVQPSTQALLFILFVSIAGSTLVNFYSPHYSAPATTLFLAVFLLAMGQLRSWGRPGLFLARAIPAICLLSFVARANSAPLKVPLSEFYEFSWWQKGAPTFGRAALEQKLEQIPGQHLVIVHYDPQHRPFDEWVYNDADIDHAKVIWARDMEVQRNRELIEYFKGREVWFLEADDKPPKLSNYSSEIIAQLSNQSQADTTP